jgi:hypothetical protein
VEVTATGAGQEGAAVRSADGWGTATTQAERPEEEAASAVGTPGLVAVGLTPAPAALTASIPLRPRPATTLATAVTRRAVAAG